jgi:hypothetical protein
VKWSPVWEKVRPEAEERPRPKAAAMQHVLFGCETWSLTVREEHKPRVFGNRVLRRIFGPKRDGVMGG